VLLVLFPNTLYAAAVPDPVPPFAIFKTPASVIAPVVALFGVNPVVPALNDVTPALLDAV
jgi:hypothetical protein